MSREQEFAETLVRQYVETAQRAQDLLEPARKYVAAVRRLALLQQEANVRFAVRSVAERDSIVGLCVKIASKLCDAEQDNAGALLSDIEVAVFQTASRAALLTKTAKEGPPQADPIAVLDMPEPSPPAPYGRGWKREDYEG